MEDRRRWKKRGTTQQPKKGTNYKLGHPLQEKSERLTKTDFCKGLDKKGLRDLEAWRGGEQNDA